MKRYALGQTDEVASDYDGEQFYTVEDCIANGEWDTIRELAQKGDPDARAALEAAEEGQ